MNATEIHNIRARMQSHISDIATLGKIDVLIKKLSNEHYNNGTYSMHINASGDHLTISLSKSDVLRKLNERKAELTQLIKFYEDNKESIKTVLKFQFQSEKISD